MASKSKKSKGSDKKASPASKVSKMSKDSKSKTLAKVVSKPQKPTPKTAKPAPKAAPAKKPVAKPVLKPAPKTPAKTVKSPVHVAKLVKPAPKHSAKAPVKAAAKSVPAKPVQKGASVKPISKAATKVVAKPIKVATKAAVKSAPKAPVRPKPAVKAPPAKPIAKPVLAKVPASSGKKTPAPVVQIKGKPPAMAIQPKAPVQAAPVPDPKAAKGKGVKIDLFKGPFFQEVVVGSPATRKNKAPQNVPSALRKPKGEESHDELIARIERELLTVRMTTRKVQREQVCTKCCINPVEPGYMVDRDTGYCLECALVLGLGHTREARQQNFHPSLMKSEEEEAVGPEIVE